MPAISIFKQPAGSVCRFMAACLLRLMFKLVFLVFLFLFNYTRLLLMLLWFMMLMTRSQEAPEQASTDVAVASPLSWWLLN